MPRPTRNLMLAALIWAGLPAFAGQTARPMVEGSVIYEADGPIPQGRVSLILEERSSDGKRESDAVMLDSVGKDKAIAFSMPMPEGEAEGMQIVARLERADGWLLARGSAPVTPGLPVEVTLNTVLY